MTHLLSQPESRTLEFKRDLSSLRPILRTLVAFANTSGGTLIVGREDDGGLRGLDDVESLEESLANTIADSIVDDALATVNEWLADSYGRFVLVLGDFGTGPSWWGRR
ncbi:MAG: ATP-binding protein [bacterium]|nr:ATP-binding protein [bacterium]